MSTRRKDQPPAPLSAADLAAAESVEALDEEGMDLVEAERLLNSLSEEDKAIILSAWENMDQSGRDIYIYSKFISKRVEREWKDK